ncbi:hypothetical protein Pcinc_036971 [Petrolisthes cinctipes]|uniref:Uncharacterized protein n=1 Tax=Petrolisthes cinctipes TaxID=88211 RepID=A0AAE1BTD0_PETCI|nr:hypothetical protein Pcinc_036971 [Petrolisthes cinctipes]
MDGWMEWCVRRVGVAGWMDGWMEWCVRRVGVDGWMEWCVRRVGVAGWIWMEWCVRRVGVAGWHEISVDLPFHPLSPSLSHRLSFSSPFLPASPTGSPFHPLSLSSLTGFHHVCHSPYDEYTEHAAELF